MSLQKFSPVDNFSFIRSTFVNTKYTIPHHNDFSTILVYLRLHAAKPQFGVDIILSTL